MAFQHAFARLTALSLLVAVGSPLQAGCSSSGGTGGISSADLRVCALMASCAGVVGAFISSWCEPIVEVEVGGNESHRSDSLSRETIQCVRGATTCTEVNACLTATPAEAAVCNGASMYQHRCSGDVLVWCGTQPLVFYDCAQDGHHCFQGASDATCGTGTCDPTTTSASCQGDVLVRCTNIGTATQPSGVIVPTDCSKQWGWALDTAFDGCDAPGNCTSLYADTCGVAGGVAQCMGSGAACNPNSYVASCSGTVVTACTGGKVAHFDCASLGPLTCQPLTYPGCMGAGTECSEGRPDTCADGVITFCMFGTTTVMDCKSYGFSGCTTSTSAVSNAARCTM